METAYPSTMYSSKGGVAVDSSIGDEVDIPRCGDGDAKPKAGAKLVGAGGDAIAAGGGEDRRSDIKSLIAWFCSTTSCDSSRN